MRGVYAGVLFGLIVLAGVPAGTVRAGESVEGEGNIVAGRLAGTWEAEGSEADGGRDAFSYLPDESVLKGLLTRYRGFIMRKRVFSAGVLTRDGAKQPALIIEHNGNPYMLTFPANGVKGYHLIVVPAGSAAGDRLFLGGEGAGDLFRGFRRRTARE